MEEKSYKFSEMFARRLDKLLEIKSIITIEVMTALTIGFVQKTVPVEVFVSIATAIVTYYFTKDIKKE